MLKDPKLKSKLYSAAVFCGILAVYFILQIPCPFRFVTGLFLPDAINCPGCGMTRAWLALLRLDIVQAFKMHGMFWSVPIVGYFFWKDWKPFPAKWLNHGALWLIGLGFAANWIIRFFI
ncbi:MAG: DUF2752 domain-containing protein [Clostridia bacterium]|nr:DUF2752 domain-containing protein [Clostridia bacterium]